MAARPLVSGAGRLTNGHTNGHTRKIGNMTSLRKQHFFSQNLALFLDFDISNNLCHKSAKMRREVVECFFI